MKNFVLIKGVFDTMDLFSEEIQKELELLGHSCHVLHMETMDVDLKNMLRAHKDFGLDGVIAFNNLGYNMGEEQGGNLWDAMGIPYVNILMDHPFHYISQLEGAPENTILYVIDRNHVDFVKRFFPKIERCHFLAHAGCANAMQEILGDLAEASSGLPEEAVGTGGNDAAALVSRPRDIDVLYAGTLSRVLIEQLIPDFKDFPEINGVIFSRNCLEDLIQNPGQTTEEVIERNVKLEFENRDLELTDERLMDYIEGFRFLDGFAVSYFREMAVRILVESGINVHVLGLGWEQCDWARDNEHLIHLGKVDAKEVLPYMLRSKIVLNTLTWFKDGAHDRIFNGMLAGAAVVSDESKYLREEETDQKTIAMFRLRELMKLPEMVADLLEDDKKRLSIARCGLEDAREHHSWRQAVGEIVDELGRV